ncbi:hypothetical protein QTP70_015737 [Hemibagrus guttatus]|uniref:non-specific serine/threonine protein kinase n=1 Tax=Hemibagrus guttatus TaxID=175788 RepID=A0AAE0PQR8_9TELE|nr:hypothetical protein QTP70_015737 [Hemibagrus guttatus]
MQKDKLMRFIQQKHQECLLHLDEPQQQKSFFSGLLWNASVTAMDVGQTCFQRSKFIYAFELFELGHFAQTLQYCETIAAEVIRCSSYADSNLIMLLKMVKKMTPQRYSAQKDEKRRNRVAAKLQQLLESQSSTQFHPSQHSELASIYTTTELLGEGGFGSVYAGVRKIDGKTVAVKCVPKKTCVEYITIVKLIDFGCGELLKDEVYNNYIGTPVYYPPEWIVHNEYFGVPVTIWSLGFSLYELVCGTTPYNNFQEIAEGNLTLPTDVSEECCMLISWCLGTRP